MSDHKQKVARAIDPVAWDEPSCHMLRDWRARRQTSIRHAKAALKAHAKHLAEQGLVVAKQSELKAWVRPKTGQTAAAHQQEE